MPADWLSPEETQKYFQAQFISIFLSLHNDDLMERGARKPEFTLIFFFFTGIIDCNLQTSARLICQTNECMLV